MESYQKIRIRNIAFSFTFKTDPIIMAKVAQIGAGLVGKAMALDLAKQHNVFLTDFNYKALKEVQSLNQNIVTSCFDLNDTDQLTEFISKSDLVLVAVPGNLGFETVQKIIKCKKTLLIFPLQVKILCY